MGGLGQLLTALPLILWGHEASHQAEADRLGTPMVWSGGPSGLPVWKSMDQGDKDKWARIANAGLLGQQEVVEKLPEGELKNSALMVSALNKLGYGVLPMGLGNHSDEGDIQSLGVAKGNNIAPLALGLSALADLHKVKNPKRTWDLDYGQSDAGTPMLVFKKKF